MEKVIIQTADGSPTISIPSWNVTYHSTYGAIQETRHVFINAGYHHLADPAAPINLLEIGFGTGLNALMTLIESENRVVFYESLEAFPLEETLVSALNYCDLLGRPDLKPAFLHMHHGDWETALSISDQFTLQKRKTTLAEYQPDKNFHLIYFDAFDPKVQPELWETDVFVRLYALLFEGGTLVTYSSKSDVRRALQYAGFLVEKIPGPPGKREMLRAVKGKSA